MLRKVNTWVNYLDGRRNISLSDLATRPFSLQFQTVSAAAGAGLNGHVEAARVSIGDHFRSSVRPLPLYPSLHFAFAQTDSKPFTAQRPPKN